MSAPPSVVPLRRAYGFGGSPTWVPAPIAVAACPGAVLRTDAACCSVHVRLTERRS